MLSYRIALENGGKISVGLEWSSSYQKVIKKQNDWIVYFLLISFGSIIPQRPSSLQNTPNDDKVKKIRKKKARQKAIETSSVRANSMTYEGPRLGDK